MQGIKVFENTKFLKVCEYHPRSNNERKIGIEKLKLKMSNNDFFYLTKAIAFGMTNEDIELLGNAIRTIDIVNAEKKSMEYEDICVQNTLRGILIEIMKFIGEEITFENYSGYSPYPKSLDADFSNLNKDEICNLLKISSDAIKSSVDNYYISAIGSEVINEISSLLVSSLHEELIIKIISGIIVRFEVEAYNNNFCDYIYFSAYKIAIALFINLLAQKEMNINDLFEIILNNINELLEVINEENELIGIDESVILCINDYFSKFGKDITCNMFLQNFCYVSNAILKNGLICKNNSDSEDKEYIYMTRNNLNPSEQSKIYHKFEGFIGNKLNLGKQMPKNCLRKILKNPEEVDEKVEEESQNEQNQQLENSVNMQIQNNSNQFSEDNNEEIAQNNISSESIQEKIQDNSNQHLDNSDNEKVNQSASSSRNNQEMPQVNVIEQNEVPPMEEPKCNYCVIC